MANFDWLSDFQDLRVKIINNKDLIIVFNVVENVFIRAVKVALKKYFT